MLRILSLISIAVLLAAPAFTQAGPSPGKSAALAAHEAARQQADAVFWTAVARQVNAPGPDLRKRLVEAWSERHEALALAREQHTARLALLATLGHEAYQPELVPGHFSADITHPHMPFVPGRTLVYERDGAEGLEQIEVTALPDAVLIAGIPCRPVREYERIDGVLVEDTINWYSQRADGSVWYLGEISRDYEDGFLSSIEGSWRYGVDGAQPGVLMPATPTAGTTYRQEYLIGVAEDVARILATGVTVTVSGRTVSGCVQTEESTPLEPDDLGTKTYAPGVGMVLEVDSATGGRLELVEIRQ